MLKLFKDGIGEPPWEYDFLVNLDEGLYPLYLKKIFKYRTGEDLPIKKVGKDKWIIDKKKCKTFNQKIQWIKLHGVTDLMRMCTDKVAVRDYVKEKIGEEYLKPVLQIIPDITETGFARHSEYNDNSGTKNLDQLPDNIDVSTYFDQIDFDNLPNAFVMKCNHGCKWQYIIKDKEQYLNTPKLVEITKRQMTGWLEQEYFPWNGFEMQYATSRRVVSHNSNSGVRTRLSEGIACDSDNEASDLPDTKRIIEPIGEINEPVYSNKYELREGCQEKGIEPKILIEPLMRDEINTPCQEIHVYCFSGMPKLVIKLHNQNEITIWDENLKITEDVFGFDEKKIYFEADETIKQSYVLSKQLVKDMDVKLVRVDWMIYQNKLYFEEMTFTPYSGFHEMKKKFEQLMIA